VKRRKEINRRERERERERGERESVGEMSYNVAF